MLQFVILEHDALKYSKFNYVPDHLFPLSLSIQLISSMIKANFPKLNFFRFQSSTVICQSPALLFLETTSISICSSSVDRKGGSQQQRASEQEVTDKRSLTCVQRPKSFLSWMTLNHLVLTNQSSKLCGMDLDLNGWPYPG